MASREIHFNTISSAVAEKGSRGGFKIPSILFVYQVNDNTTKNYVAAI